MDRVNNSPARSDTGSRLNREPPSPLDDAAWDVEAMKLFFVDHGEEWFYRYAEFGACNQNGATGFVLLGFCTPKGQWDEEDGCVPASWLPTDMRPHGQALIRACKRMRDSLR